MSDKRPASADSSTRFSHVDLLDIKAKESEGGTWLDIEAEVFWRPDDDPMGLPVRHATEVTFWGEPSELLALAERIRDVVIAGWPELTPRRLIWIENTEHGAIEHPLGIASPQQAALSDEIAADDGMGIFLIDSDNNPTTDRGPDWRGMAPRAVYVENA